MTLDDLTAFGAYLNAGFVDYYDGHSHQRLGSVNADGSLNFSDAGRKIADEILTRDALAVLTAKPDNAAEAAAKGKAPTVTDEVTLTNADLGSLDALLDAKV